MNASLITILLNQWAFSQRGEGKTFSAELKVIVTGAEGAKGFAS